MLFEYFPFSRAALTEMSVLSDILHIARPANKEQPYMVLDPVSVEGNPPKQYALQIVEKKKVPFLKRLQFLTC